MGECLCVLEFFFAVFLKAVRCLSTRQASPSVLTDKHKHNVNKLFDIYIYKIYTYTSKCLRSGRSSWLARYTEGNRKRWETSRWLPSSSLELAFTSLTSHLFIFFHSIYINYYYYFCLFLTYHYNLAMLRRWLSYVNFN